MRTLLVLAVLVGSSGATAFGQLTGQTRAQQIAAVFNKRKDIVKEKYGVRKEKYKEVRSELVVKQNFRDYVGSYEVADLGSRITIQVASDGTVQATGYDWNPQPRSFTLENPKIDGALLTARKVYSDGAAEEFEGVFMTRTERHSAIDPGATTFGLGVALRAPYEVRGITYEKLFYELKP